MKKLTIELVPRSCWFSNLRKELTRKEWDFVRFAAYERSNNKCSICGGVGFNHPVEAHEVWEYKDKEQKLIDVVALCPMCHKSKHVGLAHINGELPLVISHLAKVNNYTESEALKDIKIAFDIWKERSKLEWKLNTEWLKRQNIEL